MAKIDTQERYYTGNGINIWFAISSILFFISIILTFWDDNNDDFKVFQKEFRKIQANIAEENYESSYANIQNQVEEFEEELINKKQELEDKSEQLTNAQNELKKYQGKYYQSNMAYLAHKGDLDALKYRLENDRSHHDKNYENPYQSKFNDANQKLIELRSKREQAEKKVSDAEKVVNKITHDFNLVEKKLKSLTGDVDLLRSNLERLSFEHMSTMNKIGNVIRDLPILDFMDPYYKVKQVVVDEIKYNVNFAQVQTVDRCMSCHLGIDKKGFEDYPQPYTTHPNLDLYLTSASAHPIDRFGCTGCHAGRARGTTFNSSVHMPNSIEQKHQWEEEYDWHKMHHWLKPMMPTKYSEAGCFKCHASEANIKGADKLSYGLTLIEKAGCYGCHAIEKYQDKRKNGPSLKRINEKVDKEWTRKWVWDPKGFRHNTWMPAFFMQSNNSDPASIKRNKTEVFTIVEYLFNGREEIKKDKDFSKYLGDSSNGEKLYNSLGCQGCHVIQPDPVDEENNAYNLLNKQGSNLIGLGSKTTPEWIFNWIKNPTEYFPDTRMPDLRLTDLEARDITAYLYNMKNIDFENSSDFVLDEIELNNIAESWLKKSFTYDNVKQKLSAMNLNDKIDYVAKKSIGFYGCSGCHVIDDFENAKPIGVELTYEGSKPLEKLDFGYVHDIEHTNHAWFEQKLKNPRIFDLHKELAPEDKSRMPNFNFNQEQIEAIVTAILGFTEDVVDNSIQSDVSPNKKLINKGLNLIKEYNCQGCHIVNDFGGKIADSIGKPEYSAPNLNTQGAKTNPEWLYDFLNKPITIRPNLKLRMPSFHLSDDNWNAIIAGFRAMDNEHNTFEEIHTINKKSSKYLAGKKLAELGACENCHFIGTTQPKQLSSTWAPNLVLTKDRLRPEWVVEWLRAPNSIMPGTKMPAPFLPETEYLSMEGAEKDWGEAVIDIGGDKQEMLEGIRDWIYGLKGKSDISDEVKKYFDKNGYPFLEKEKSDENDSDDEDWGDEDEDW